MKTSDAFPSKYLKADDFDADTTLTVSGVEMDTLKNKKGEDEQKPICYFEETDKGLVLNKTNWDAIAKQHGDESDNWIGKAVILTVIDVDAFGEVKPAIRIKAPRKVSANPIRTSAPAPAGNGNNTKSANDAPTSFWAYAYQHEISKTDATAYLTEAQNDFARALELMKAQNGS